MGSQNRCKNEKEEEKNDNDKIKKKVQTSSACGLIKRNFSNFHVCK